MTDQNNRKRRFLALGAALTVAVPAGVMGTTALASAGDSEPTYTACLANGGKLYNLVVSPTPPERCVNDDRRISWNETGPEGPQGAPGPQGPPGPQGEPGPAGPGDVQVAAYSPLDMPPAPAQPPPDWVATVSRTLASHDGLSIVLECHRSRGRLGTLSGYDTFGALYFEGPASAVIAASSAIEVRPDGRLRLGTASSFGPRTESFRGDYNASDASSGAVLNGSFFVRAAEETCWSQGDAVGGP